MFAGSPSREEVQMCYLALQACMTRLLLTMTVMNLGMAPPIGCASLQVQRLKAKLVQMENALSVARKEAETERQAKEDARRVRRIVQRYTDVSAWPTESDNFSATCRNKDLVYAISEAEVLVLERPGPAPEARQAAAAAGSNSCSGAGRAAAGRQRAAGRDRGGARGARRRAGGSPGGARRRGALTAARADEGCATIRPTFEDESLPIVFLQTCRQPA